MFITPEREHGIVFRKADSIYGYQGWPSVCKTDDGTLISICSGYRMQHICPFGKTVINISRDEGRTWSSPVIINDTPLDDRDAGIVNLGGKRLLATWFCHPAEVYEKQYITYIKNACSPDEALIALAQIASYRNLSAEQRRGGSFIKISEDGGMTWSETVTVPVSAPHGPGLLSDGSLLYLGKELYSTDEKTGVVAVYNSSDGYTWFRLAEIAILDGCKLDNFHEPHVLELPDGRLLGAIRAEGAPVCHGFTIYTTFSDDRGKTWSIPKSLDVCGSPPHLMLHSSGAVICSFGRREAPFGEHAIVSYDNGRTWDDEYNIDDRADGGDLGYPASVELSDGSIFTLYYQRYPGDSKTSILYTKWKLK
jgi:sialidase-1